MPCITVTNFCSEGKVILQLSVVHYQLLLCLDTNAIAINKLCKLNFRYIFYHVLTYKSTAGSGFLKVQI